MAHQFVLDRFRGAGLVVVPGVVEVVAYVREISETIEQILLRLQPGLTERQAAERLEELRTRVAGGHADFADLAREYSQDACYIHVIVISC